MGEADIAASFFTCLAGQLKPGSEKRRLVELITSGKWYDWLLEGSPVNYPGRDQLKVEAQRQLLFGRDWRVAHKDLEAFVNARANRPPDQEAV